jgi:DNA-directed RNA polymerase-3 subunit RPC5
MHLAPTYSEQEVLQILPVYADLVRGLWVCKSSLLYDDGHAPKRDRIILEFTKRESISMEMVDKLLRDVRTRNMILNPLGKRREKLKDYKFIVAADSSFIKRYSHIVREQENAWSVREATLADTLEKCSTTEQRKTKISARSNIPVKGPDSVMGKTRDGLVQGSETHVRSVLDSVFTANKVRR